MNRSNLDPDTYFAGLFDGEGSFSIYKRKIKAGFSYHLDAAVTIREKFILDAMQRRYGGSVNPSKDRHDEHCITWRWRAGSVDALEFVELIIDRLQVKHAHGLCFLQAARLLYAPEDARKRGPTKAQCYRKLCILNRRGKTRRTSKSTNLWC